MRERTLYVAQIAAAGEPFDRLDLPLLDREHRGTDLGVIVRPQQIGAYTGADQDDDQIENRHVVGGGPRGTRIRWSCHGHCLSLPEGAPPATCRAAGADDRCARSRRRSAWFSTARR